MTPRDGLQQVRFGDIAANINDFFDRDHGPESRVVAGQNISEDRLVIRSWSLTTDPDFRPTFKRKFSAGDVLFHSRNIAKLGVPDFDGVTGEKLFVLRSKGENRLVQKFLPWLVLSPSFRQQAERSLAGSVNKFLNWTPLAQLSVELPPIAEQHEIAELLWATERLSEAYSTSRAIQATGARTYMQTRLTDFQTATVRLGELIDEGRPLCYGVVQPGRGANDGVPLIRVCDIETDLLDTSALRTISRTVHEQYRRSVVRRGDVLVSVVGTIGRTVVVPPEADGFNIARAVARISPDSTRVIPEFLVAVLQTPKYQQELIAAGFESARRTLNLSSLAEIQIPVPPLSVQREIVGSLIDWRSAADRTCEQQMSLKRLRNRVLRHLG